jgi:predicted AAA+ superfamily ATPase
MLKDTLKDIIASQQVNNLPEKSIARGKLIPRTSQITIITGIRRCGKSTLLKQLLQKEKSKAYVNFEDPRLVAFTLKDFEKLELIFREQGFNTCYLDEIQNVPQWERYIRAAHDKGIKIYITGSNASLLSRELGTKLTGRYIQTELFPFSYKECLQYYNQQAGPKTLEGYLRTGGFPEYLKGETDEYLRTIFRDIILRDIVVRQNLRNENTIMQLATFIITNIGKPFSYNNLTKALNIKSIRTTIDYCDYLQETYLIGLIPKHSLSLKKELSNPKKAYCIDNGLVTANTLSFSEDKGRKLENMIYQQLRRKHQHIFYHKEQHECDFLVKEMGAVTKAVQVCWKINEDNLKREADGLKEALTANKKARGVFITFDQEDVIERIPVVPAWKWLLES